jgi:hypothetical protein
MSSAVARRHWIVASSKRVSPALPEELMWKPKSPSAESHDPSLRREREEEPAAVIPVIE